MLYGWVNEESERQTGEDAWKNGVYYLGEAGDGAMRANEWAWLEAEDEEQDDPDFEDHYWFYFKSNGEKTAGTKKTSTEENICLRKAVMQYSTGFPHRAMRQLPVISSIPSPLTAG